VREYIVWRTQDNAIDWFILRGGRYDRLQLDADGIYKSECFPGLWLDPTALLGDNLATVLKVLGEGTLSQEHEQFVMAMKQRIAEER
jgi:hypothetical protein